MSALDLSTKKHVGLAAEQAEARVKTGFRDSG